MTTSSDMTLVMRVIDHLNLHRQDEVTPQKKAQILGYISESLLLIAPFKPSEADAAALNNHLISCGASHMECIIAWSYYMDLSCVANLHNVRTGERKVA